MGSQTLASLPTRERELKHFYPLLTVTVTEVAPHAGARIETLVDSLLCTWLYVAPHAGARIETLTAW